MRRTSLRTRIAAGVTVVATAAAAAVALAPSAGAAVPVPGAAIAASTIATVYTDIPNQAAGDWRTVSLPNVAVGDWIDIQIDDHDANGQIPAASNNCVNPGDTVGFSSIPTVTNLTPENTARFSASLHQGGVPNSGPCDHDNVNVDDVLRLTATAGGGPGAELAITGLRLSIGANATPGPIRYRVNGTGDFTTVNTIASISAVRVSSVDPLVLVSPNAQNSLVSNVVFQEQRAAAIPGNNVCLRITAPAGTTFDGTIKPVAAVSGGNAQVEVVSSSGSDAKFKINATSSQASRIELSNLLVDTGANQGPIDAQPLGDCANEGSAYGPKVRLGWVGTVQRVPGANRYATAQQIAEPLGCNADTSVVIARGDNFPDALSAAYLAGRNQAPILLTAPNQLPSETIAALKKIGAKSVTLIGGTGAISAAVQDAIDRLPVYDCGTQQPVGGDLTLTVARISGADRYATARNVAATGGLGTVGTTDSGLDGIDCAGNLKKTAIVASGENFPDALAAGPLSYAGLLRPGGACGSGPIPLLLTQQAGIPQITVDAILEHGIQQVVLMGGTGAVSTAVETAIDNLDGGKVNVIRIAGPDRQSTAAELAKRVLGPDNLGSFGIPLSAGGGGFLVARPDQFPDALAAAALAGSTASPIFLASSNTALGTVSRDAIATYPSSGRFTKAILLGGTLALEPSVATDAGKAMAAQRS